MSLESDWLQLTENAKHYSPSTRSRVGSVLCNFEEFLRTERKLSRPDRVKIEDFVAYEDWLLAEGKRLSTVKTNLNFVKSYYSMLANLNPNSRWPGLVAQLKTHKPPKDRSSPSPHEPFPLELIPEILDAAREVGGDVYPLVAGFVYTGMRATEMMALQLNYKFSKIVFDEGWIGTRVKGGHYVIKPLHDDLSEIWREHLTTREYESDFLFKLGKWPYHYADKGGGTEEITDEDSKNSRRNRGNVVRLLRKVEAVLKERGIELHMNSHRFRKSVWTIASEFGLDETDGRLILSHKAKSITDDYDMRDVAKVKARWTLVRLGSREWVEEHKEDEFTIERNGINGATNGRLAKLEELASLTDDQLDALLKLARAMGGET
jgi:site-specific recombinase XerD